MGSLDMRSGDWRCRWTQEWVVGIEDLTMEFADGKILGKGSDPQGVFEYTGSYDLGTGTVVLTKRYTAPSVRVPKLLWYIGNWDGEIIGGRWTFGESLGESGPFEMWPVDEEMTVEYLLQEEGTFEVAYSLS